MRIRSITCFIDPSYPLRAQTLTKAREFIHVCMPLFTQAGYEVQSARLATVPFPQLLAQVKNSSLADLSSQLEARSADMGYSYVSMGPAMPNQTDDYSLITTALASTQNVFFAGAMTTPGGEISLRAIQQCARVIHSASTISPDGFANLRFAALANVPPGSPFFPAAYHQGGEASFALATEAADLAEMAFGQADTLATGRRNLISAVEEHARKLASLAQEAEHASGVRFGGLDFSLAPFPSEERSLGTAMERLGVPMLGVHGSLAAAAILADTLDQAVFPRAGFSGLMLPVLEDAVLAQRAAQGSLEVMDLLLYSAVCGTGLDTVPLPGDATEEQLSAVLLDLASLSSRLAKPLTARLLPIPGKKAGDATSFDFAYFANSRVMSLRAVSLSGHLAGSEAFSLHRRAQHA
jgi:uncharacterized protein (UPF0210 family)